MYGPAAHICVPRVYVSTAHSEANVCQGYVSHLGVASGVKMALGVISIGGFGFI